MENNDIQLLIKVAQMYYEESLTQDEIAKKLSIYRTTVSRLLKKAKEHGVVSFKINYELSEEFLLEKKLKEKFDLLNVIICDNDKTSSLETLDKLGLCCASYLKQIISDGDIIGLSWGRSLAAVAENLDTSFHKKVICIPMVGGPAGKLESKFHVNTIAYTFADKLHGQSLLMDFPAILDNTALRDAIIHSEHYQQISNYWDHLSIAIFGIGSFNLLGRTIWSGFYGNDEVKSTNNELIVGDICSRFYNQQGITVKTTISDKIININLEQLKKTKFRIGVAESAEKSNAIIAAMMGKMLNVLVTTKTTAKAILNNASI